MKQAEKSFQKDTTLKSRSGIVSWESPANIALVKYWGKKPGQLPWNPSLSLTLSKSVTLMNVEYNYTGFHEDIHAGFEFSGDNKNPAFGERVIKYVEAIKNYLPMMAYYDFKIRSFNNFPHSSGISSSASAFSALALCFTEIEQASYKDNVVLDEAFYKKASFLARLGSGSACRSMYGGLVLWGHTEWIEGSSDEYALKLCEGISPVIDSIHDTILLIDRSVKPILSSAGHALMDTNPYSVVRYRQAEKHLKDLITAIKKGDLDSFFNLIEIEAFELHAMLLTSFPGYILLKPGTLRIIEMVRNERLKGLPIGFTIDAGANIHLLYPADSSEQVFSFIRNELPEFHDSDIITDHVGKGPVKVTL